MTSLENLNISRCSVKNIGIGDLKLIYLNASYNENITDLNFMISLKKLDVSGEWCGIGDFGISQLKLKKLYAYNNNKITNLNFMTSLKKLNVSGYNSGVGDNGIKNLNLKYLCATDNQKIRDINHMTFLKKLHADFNCGITDAGILQIRNNLKILSCDYNSKITNAHKNDFI